MEIKSEMLLTNLLSFQVHALYMCECVCLCMIYCIRQNNDKDTNWKYNNMVDITLVLRLRKNWTRGKTHARDVCCPVVKFCLENFNV